MTLIPANPVWLFDLDNTLHNASAHIFPQINQAMTRYLATHLHLDETRANELRRLYWTRYGATLLGMTRNHGTNPRHFLHHTHQFDDLARLVVFERRVLAHLRSLPGQRYVFSNAPRAYLDRVLRITGLCHVLDGSFSVEDLRFCPKPKIRAYREVLRQLNVRAGQCIMVEDTVENLRVAKRLGMQTIWIAPAQRRPNWVDRRLSSVLDLPRGQPRATI